MSDNLIDLEVAESIEETATQGEFLHEDSPMENSWRLSLDNNNPFDCLQKIVTIRQNEPFEIPKGEFNPGTSDLCCRNDEIKTGNLIVLKGEDLCGLTECQGHSTDCNPDPNNMNPPNIKELLSDVGKSPNIHSDLENESPPTVLFEMTPDGQQQNKDCQDMCNSTPNCGHSKSSKPFEHRKHLLKLSLSNSASQTPTTQMKAPDLMLVDESPIKFVDEDDIMQEQPPQMVSSDIDFEADLQMLKLNDSLVVEKTSNEIEAIIVVDENNSKTNVSSAAEVSTVAPLPDLREIRAKLKTRREECSGGSSNSDNQQDMSHIIQSLKTLICDTDSIDSDKKEEAKSLLESLSIALKNHEAKNQQYEIDEGCKHSKPRPFVRQSTFDIDLQDDDNNDEQNNGSIETAENLQSPNKPGQPIEPIPDAMICSSATYDGETAAEKADLVLPEVEPLSPPQALDVSMIIEQLQHVLENAVNSSNGSPNINPTLFVVMPQTTAAFPKQRQIRQIQQDYSEDIATTTTDNSMRRRSQSLSVHDKIKVVHLSLPTVSRTNNQSPDSPESELGLTPTVHDANIIKTPSRPLPRRNSFSNASSHSTPFPRSKASVESSINSRRSMQSINAAFKSPGRPNNARRFSTIEAISNHHPPVEMQRQLPLRNNIGVEIRRTKDNSRESILRSSAPMKATVPIKRVAPMLKTTGPSHSSPSKLQGNRNAHNASSLANTSLINKSLANASMQLVSKSGPISDTSTPMLSKRNVYRVIHKSASAAAGISKSTNISKAHNGASSTFTTTPKKRPSLDFLRKSPMKATTSIRPSSNITASSIRAHVPTARHMSTAPKTLSSRMQQNENIATKNKENKQP